MKYPTMKYLNVCVCFLVWTGIAFAQPSTRSEPSQTYDQNLALEAICGADNISSDASGCRVCPAGTGRAGEETYNLMTGVYRGSFSAANQQELVVDMQGCEPRVNGVTGTYLLTIGQDTSEQNTTAQNTTAQNTTAQDYAVSNYYTGAQGRTCDIYTHADGIDRFLCQGGGVFQGFVYQSLDAVSYVNSGFQSVTLASGLDASGACMSGEQLESFFDTTIPEDFPTTPQIDISRRFERATYDSCDVVSREADASFNYTWTYQDGNWRLATLAQLLDVGLSVEQYEAGIFQLQLTDLPSPTLLEFLDGSLDADTFIRTFTP